MTVELVAGRYRLGELIGTGGMGRVWLASDEMLRRDVAVKEVLLPDGLTEEESRALRLRTLREARAAARLSHPNVVRIYDVLYAGQRPWIVMEYIRGRSLARVIKESGPLTSGHTAYLGLSICAALSAAHAAGVLHRDVKPGNILLGEDGRVVLTDFGLATYDEVGVALTQPGIIHGSPQFIAPERAQDGTSSTAADMWSLGATLYAAVEGHSPYSRPTSMATLTALATSPPDPPRLAGSLKPVLLGLLRKNPKSRMRPEEVMTRLRRIAARDDGATRLIPRPRRDDERLTDDASMPESGPVGRNASAAPSSNGWPAEDFSPDGGIVPSRTDIADAPRVIYPERIGRRNTSEFDLEPFSYGDPRTVRERRVGPWVRATLLILPLLLVAAVVAAKAGADTNRGVVTSPPTPTAAPTASWPCEPGTPASSATATPVPSADDGIARGHALPPGWVWYADPTGFHVAVPAGWAMSRSETAVCFRDPSSGRTLGVNTSTPPNSGPLGALRAEEVRLTANGGLPGYQRIRFTKVPFLSCCAEWEYTYTGLTAPLHVIVRDNVGPAHRAYAVSWLTTGFDWVANRPNYDLIATSFRPPA